MFSWQSKVECKFLDSFGKSVSFNFDYLDPDLRNQSLSLKEFNPNGMLTRANRYDVKSDSSRHVDSYHNYTHSEEFQKFVQRINSQTRYNYITQSYKQHAGLQQHGFHDNR